ncbi:ArsR/SmtB family transcription factor [Arthrobacter sp. ERGS1:01]|uniref:ArsR/SmtB family transcription factor n=1 Tax=Arthrobacter sp. ERGS1:01 TaxID=1704044 RepID=UPI001ED998F6
MANPFRSRILDALYVDGASTASGLAQRTGQAVGSISHHLKVLSQAGLIEEAPELARDRRERLWRVVAPATRWSRTEFADDPGAVTGALAAESLTVHGTGGKRPWLRREEISTCCGSARASAFLALQRHRYSSR